MKTTKTTRTRATLLDAAAAVFAKKPTASLQDVAEAAQVGRATLYRYFPTREVLLRELALAAIQQTKAAVDPIQAGSGTGREKLERIIAALIPLGDRFNFLMSELAVYHAPEVASAYEHHLYMLATVVEQVKREGALAMDVPTAWCVAAIDGLIWAAWPSVQEGYIARRDAAPLVVRTLFNGLGPSET